MADVWSIAFCATSSILFCLYASRRKNGDLLHNEEAKRLPLLMQSTTNLSFPRYMFILCKINLLKSHIIVVKKVELDRRNGYISPANVTTPADII